MVSVWYPNLDTEGQRRVIRGPNLEQSRQRLVLA